MPTKHVPLEQFIDAEFPMRGIDVSGEISTQRPGTTRIGENVRAYEPATQRGRGASRAGLVRFIDEQVSGDNPIQMLNFIVDPTTDAIPPEAADYLGDEADPSTSNLRRRQPTSGNRLVRHGGSGAWFSRNTPKRLLTISADAQTKEEGQVFTFVGDEFAASGLIAGDTLTGVSLSSQGSPAGAATGTYTIALANAQGSVIGAVSLAAKYKIRYVPSSMTVYQSGLKLLSFYTGSFNKAINTTVTRTLSDVAVTGLEVGDSVSSITIGCAGFAGGAGLGDYPIVLSAASGTIFGGGTLASKYTLVYQPAVCSVVTPPPHPGT